MTWYNKDKEESVLDLEVDVTADMEEMDGVFGRTSREYDNSLEESVTKKDTKKSNKSSKKKKENIIDETDEPKTVEPKTVEPKTVEPEVVEKPAVVEKKRAVRSTCAKCKRPIADNGKGFCKICGSKL